MHSIESAAEELESSTSNFRTNRERPRFTPFYEPIADIGADAPARLGEAGAPNTTVYLR